ncbi:hypothetical protein JCM15764A_12770 [Geotalea toluenoxydans]|uniref:hypothetical protein n=1 Tax=Geotalea toluenoxydans TaxID=421624 RepID=UPI001FB22192|nr:hypothetical protein [Geotalea toluenoxydans]
MEKKWSRLEVDLVEVAEVLEMVHDELAYSVEPSRTQIDRCTAAVSLALTRLDTTTAQVVKLVCEHGKNQQTTCSRCK